MSISFLYLSVENKFSQEWVAPDYWQGHMGLKTWFSSTKMSKESVLVWLDLIWGFQICKFKNPPIRAKQVIALFPLPCCCFPLIEILPWQPSVIQVTFGFPCDPLLDLVCCSPVVSCSVPELLACGLSRVRSSGGSRAAAAVPGPELLSPVCHRSLLGVE